MSNLRCQNVQYLLFPPILKACKINLLSGIWANQLKIQLRYSAQIFLVNVWENRSVPWCGLSVSMRLVDEEKTQTI